MAVINSINIETFRGISNLKLDNLAEINILTGDNNSGKTSILEILQSLEEPDSFKIWRTLLRRGTFINRGLSYYEGFYDLFNINDEKKIIKYNVQSEEKNIKVEFENSGEIDVFADDFYIEQVITNYITNAIKNIKEVNKKKIIKVTNELNEDKQIVRVKVFNTGDNIKEENLMRIWNRFYKVDESRNRADGGTGIGLSFVKAVMNNYEQDYGIINKEDGVEFFFDLKYTGLKM